MPIRTRLILWYSGLLAIIVIVFSGAVYSVMSWTLVNAVDSTLDETAGQVIKNSRVQRIGEFGGPDNMVILLPRLDIFRASGVGVQVWDTRSDSPSLAAASTNISDFPYPLDADALGLDSGSVYSNAVINGQPVRVLTRPMVGVELMGESRAFANVQAVASLVTVIQARERLLVVMLVSGGLGILGSVMLGMWLSRQALQPINRITEAAARIATTDDLSTRLVWNGPRDELGRLASVFNQMMDRLEHLFSVQRRFVADVSHELRTPLTAIRGNLDLVRRYGADAMSLEAVESEVERMSRMVNDLLLLARADYGGLTLEMEPVDLDALLIEVHKQARLLSKDRSLSVIVDEIAPVRVNGNPDRLKQLVLNLVHNAIKFTPDGGTVGLALRQRGTEAVIVVRDTGIGISPEDQARIFDRFYQADTSRKHADGDGSGLGLSIARWIAEAHGGAITVESALGRGSVFTIALPALGNRPTNGPGSEHPTHTASKPPAHLTAALT